MTKPLSTVAAALLAVFVAASAVQAGDAPSREQLARWVDELGSEQFQARQLATQGLLSAGPPAAEFLITAVRQGDAEVRARAIRVLSEQAMSLQEERRAPARQALLGLADAPEPLAARAAQGALEGLREMTIALAVGELTRLGATVMPQENTDPIRYAVQIRQSWTGGDDRLSLLGDLGGVPWLSLENAPITDAALPHIAKLTDLERLYLGSSRIKGHDLSQLAPLTKLKYLSLKGLPIENTSLKTLPTFRYLEHLGLDFTSVGDDALADLARYPALQTLWLDSTQITDAGLAHLKPLVNLRTLFIPSTKATGPGLAELKHLPNLTYVSLKECKLGPDSLKHIAQLEQLETLGLDHTSVTNEQLADIAGMLRLRILWLSKTEITDAGLAHLKGLKNLQVVYLHGSQVTSEGAEELRKSLPNCHIAR